MSFNFEHPNINWGATDLHQEFQRFKSHVDFVFQGPLSDSTEKQKCGWLGTWLGEHGREIYKTLIWADGEKDRVDSVLDKFEKYVQPRKNKRMARHRLKQRKQKESEGFDNFVKDLRLILLDCDYSDPDDILIDAIIDGVQEKKLQEKLLDRGEGLTLAKALEIGQQHELSKRQMKMVREETKSIDIDFTQRKRLPNNKIRPDQEYPGLRCKGRPLDPDEDKGRNKKHQTKNKESFRTKSKCSRCGRNHPPSACPAYGKKCMKCHKLGHFYKMCKSLQEIVEDKNQDTESDLDTNFVLKTLEIDSEVTHSHVINDETDCWMVELNMYGSKLQFKIDTGADISVISQATYKRLRRKPKLSKSSVKLSSPGGKLKAVGEFVTRVKHRSKTYSFRIVVIEQSVRNNLLSRTVATRLGLVKRVESIQEDVFGPSGLLKTEPVKIKLKEDAKPYNILTPRRVPFPLQKTVKEELDRMESAGIIEQITEPTDWCAPMVPVRKRNGKIRICVDFKRLNAAVKRPHYMLPNLDDIAPKLVGCQVFSTLDVSSGFFQIPLDKHCSFYTTFITPFGKYCFKRLPMGISLGPEVFQIKMEETLKGIVGCQPICDDIIVYGKNEKEHEARLTQVLERIKDSGLKLNKAKCNFRQKQVKYFGHIISGEGIRPDEDKVKAIRELKEPTNISELRTIMGMFNYLAKYVPHMASHMKPMSDLLKSEIAFYWGPEQQSSFDRVKDKIANSPVLNFYDVNRPTVVSADASSYGLGATLLQHDGTKVVPIAFASRTLSNAERNYAQIEKECLAATWACEKFSRYLVGLQSFELQTDHKPLVPIIAKKDLDRTPIRCQRMLIRLMRFNAKVVHKPGKELVIADALSRFPTSNQGEEILGTEELEEVIKVYVDAFENDIEITPGRLESLRCATVHDKELQQVMSYVLNGWPSKVPEELVGFQKAQGDLSVKDGLLVMNKRIVVPEAQRKSILMKLHETHQGLNKCRQNAQNTVWWPGLSTNFKKLVSNCAFCRKNQPKQRKEPLIPSKIPDRPWKKIGIDLMESGNKMYLVVMDYYSRWIEVLYLQSATTRNVIMKLKSVFATHGLPDMIRSDNGPQFTAREFKYFLRENEIALMTSSPNFPQSNGLAESGVKIAKKLLKQTDFELALMNYRSTPHSSTNVSPAEALMGRKIRTKLPILDSQLEINKEIHKKIVSSDQQTKAKYKKQYDKHHGAAKSLPSLAPGDTVLIRDETDPQWTRQGTVVAADNPRRTYLVNTDGGVRRRNRHHLQKISPRQHMERNAYPLELPETFDPESESEESPGTSPINEPIDSPHSSSCIGSPPTSATNTNKYQTRLSCGYVAPKPVRFREEGK